MVEVVTMGLLVEIASTAIRHGWRLLAWLALGLVGSVAEAQTDYAHPWNPASPLPQFITHVLVDPANLTAITKFRSCVGHVYVDNYESSINQSMKNYYVPTAQYQGTGNSLVVYAPTSGTITGLTPDGFVLSTGEVRGYQFNITPDAYPMFGLVIFHIDPAPGIVQGMHVEAGQPIGFADTREAVNFDMAVQAIWGAMSKFQNLNPGHPLTNPDFKYVSAFDVMTPEVLAQFAPYGLTDPGTMVLSFAYRVAHSLTNQGNTPDGFDTNEYFVYPPWFTQQPANLFVIPSVTASFFVLGQCDTGPFTYQWSKNGVPISGATSRALFVPNAQASDMGFYTATVTTLAGSATSTAAILTVSTGGPSRLMNVSTLGFVPAGGQLTAGFVVRGTGNKSVLVRGVGPALGSFGVAGFLADPKLEVIPAGSPAALVANDDWMASVALTTTTSAVGAFALTAGSKDAAALVSLPGDGGYTVRVIPASAGQAGIALAEIYDAEPLSAPGRLVNLSTLGVTGANGQMLTVGFNVSGSAPKAMLIRAVGPGLASFGVSQSLADPQLAVIPAGLPLVIAANSGWSGTDQTSVLQSAFATVGAFPLNVGSQDAALTLRLPPGGYTVQASSAAGGQGTVLVEVYDLDP